MALVSFLDSRQSRVRVGTCREIMATMPSNSVDSIVCDPPYALTANKKGGTGEASLNLNSPAGRSRITTGGFMGKKWDANLLSVEDWAEALRVAKPGAYLVAFGGTRTSHRLTCAIEDAGWEIRDTLMWLYGSGFPKSRDIAKDFDKGMRKVVGVQQAPGHAKANVEQGRTHTEFPKYDSTPVSDLAHQWQGWGTALKPGHEPICLARKPLVGTVAANVAEYGTGGLNIDATRIGTSENLNGGAYAKDGTERHDGTESWRYKRGGGAEFKQPTGRWPANVCLSHAPECREVGTRRVKVVGATAHRKGQGNGGMFVPEGSPHPGYRDADGMETVTAWECVESCPVALLDAQSGKSKSAGGRIGNKDGGGIYGGGKGLAGAFVKGDPGYGDTGGASRFYYTSKASRREREAGLGDLSASHPTVKPLALMRWLCRLVTPPGGLILDLCCGSGSTGCAAVLEGFRFRGIDAEAEYVEIARRRIKYWQRMRDGDEP